jgi:hypothetical protein
MKHKLFHTLTASAITAVFVTAGIATAAPPANGPAGARGLDSLDERDVYINLINLKQTALAKADMEAHKVPDAEQQQMFAMADLETLVQAKNLTAAKRRALALSAANGLVALMPKTDDPEKLLEYANSLVKFGIDPTVDDLDYFGDNPQARAELKPVAETAKSLYDKASKQIDAKVQAAYNRLGNNPAPALVAQVQAEVAKIGGEQTIADFSNNMTSYALCISYPPGAPERKKVADEAIGYLKDYDTPTSQVQPRVKNMIGKLDLATGDLAGAKAMFDPVIAGADGPVKPVPTPIFQNTARFFSIVAELDGKDFSAAAANEAALEAWQKTALAQVDAGTLNAIAAAMGMLKFHILTAQADAAGPGTPAAKKFNDDAITALVALLQSQPNNPILRDQIFDQIRGRIGPNPDFARLDPLALLAIKSEGMDNYIAVTVDKKPADAPVIEKAIAASKELASRMGQPGVNQEVAEDAARFVPYAYQFVLHKDADAAAGYIDFATKFKSDQAKSDIALDNCYQILHGLEAKQNAKQTGEAEDEQIRALWTRYLPLAIGAPYNRTNLAYRYAMLLIAQEKWADATPFLSMVPKTDPRFPDAQFYKMIALNQSLDDSKSAKKLTGDQRRALAKQTIDLADTVQKSCLDAASAAATPAANKRIYIERAVAAVQTAANLSRTELKDFSTSLKWAESLDTTAAGLEDAERKKAIHIIALKLACLDYLDSGQTAKAVQTDLDLLAVDPAAGQQLLIDVNGNVDRDMTAAMDKKDTPQIKKLTEERAALTGEIVKWAASSKDPKVQANLHDFRIYDAYSQKQAAELLDDGDAKTAALKAALADYQTVLSTNKDDTEAALGSGLVDFDLGNYPDTIKYLSPFLKLGALQPTQQVSTPTGIRIEEDPRYWEVLYKFTQANVNEARKNKNDSQLQEAKRYLAGVYVQYPSTFGGARWGEQSMALLKQLAPDLVQGKR